MQAVAVLAITPPRMEPLLWSCPDCGAETVDRVAGVWCPRCRLWVVVGVNHEREPVARVLGPRL